MAKGKGGFIGQDGLNAPDSPTGVSGSAGDTEVDVSFTAPSDVGGSAITGYRVQDSTGAHGASGSSSPITVSGLTNGTSYTFNVWAINAFGWSAPSDASGGVTPTSPARGVFFGGVGASVVNTIQYITIPTTGNATDFGDLNTNSNWNASTASSTRGLCQIGYDENYAFQNTIEYITIATTGNASDFGDLTQTAGGGAGISNGTRGVFALGYAGGRSNVMEYVTIASAGNASDFGDLTEARQNPAGTQSTTRGVFGGGLNNSSVKTVTMDYITTASAGNATDYGDLTQGRDRLTGGGTSTRGIFGGGRVSASVNTIDYITIASTGNATDFGNLSEERNMLASASDKTRTTFAGGYNAAVSATYVNRIDYITTASTGNATDFGDLLSALQSLSGTSNGHGGLS